MNQSSGVQVSVIMACRNSSPYLQEAIESVLNQTLKDLELIIVDDCSSDNTLDIARSYQQKDGRVVIVSLKERSGPAAVRNAGIEMAKGEWIGILDSDDIAMSMRFEEQIKLTKNKNVVMVTSYSATIDERGNFIRAHKYATKNEELIPRLYSGKAFPAHSSMLYRKQALKQFLGFNPRFERAQDYDLWLRLSENGEIVVVDKFLVRIRKHKKNISNTEDGMLQIRFAHAAAVCHFLRVKGHPDPSVDDNAMLWEEFFKWVDGRMKDDGAFERHKTWITARSEYFSTENRLLSVFKFGFCLMRSGCGSALVLEKFFGSSLPERLAQEWVQLNHRDSLICLFV